MKKFLANFQPATFPFVCIAFVDVFDVMPTEEKRCLTQKVSRKSYIPTTSDMRDIFTQEAESSERK